MVCMLSSYLAQHSQFHASKSSDAMRNVVLSRKGFHKLCMYLLGCVHLCRPACCQHPSVLSRGHPACFLVCFCYLLLACREQQRSWLYRIRPSVTHEPFHALNFPTEQVRWWALVGGALGPTMEGWQYKGHSEKNLWFAQAGDKKGLVETGAQGGYQGA